MQDTPHQQYLHRSTTLQRHKVVDALRTCWVNVFAKYGTRSPDELRFMADCDSIASQIESCGRFPVLYMSGATGELAVCRNRCRSRSCPYCSLLRSREITQRVTTLLKHMDSPRFLTLTMKSSHVDLPSQIKRLKTCFSRFRRTSEWRKHVIGGLSVIEITYTTEQGWHPHLHLIVDGSYWSQKKISFGWKKITGDSDIVDIRAIWSRSNAASYISKYIAKSWGNASYDDLVIVEQCMSTRGMRTLSTFGTLHNVKTTKRKSILGDDVIHVCSLYDLYHQAYYGDVRAQRLIWILDKTSHARRDEVTGMVDIRILTSMRKLYRWIIRYNNPPIRMNKPPPPPPPPPHLWDNDTLTSSIV